MFFGVEMANLIRPTLIKTNGYTIITPPKILTNGGPQNDGPWKAGNGTL